MSAIASKTAARSASVMGPALDEPLTIDGRRIPTSETGLRHYANYLSILGNVSFEFEEIVAYAPRFYELVSPTFTGYT